MIFAAAALVAALTAGMGTLAMRAIARKYNIADHPSERRINTKPVPRAGGLAVAGAFALIGTLLVIFSAQLGLSAGSGSAELTSDGAAALLLGTVIAGVIGLIDDRYDLRARWQIIGQFLIALIPIAFGLRIAFISNPFGAGDLLFPDAIALGVTIFWTLGMQNSMNFIDGLDGLSGGISLFAAVTLGVIALPTSPLLAALSFTLAGALAGFLRFNFYPASIYMGTSGILAVAYALAVLALLGTAKVAAALLILGVPIIDALFVIVGRIAAGRSPYTPDESHIHRRLLSYGFSHRGSVLVLYALTAALSILALLLTGSATLYAFMGLLVVLGGVVAYLSRATERTSK
ncbi:MAG: undecaprenyl/decaprenyl-phosphate alpha-N-acetylglucosaminyl 1-phosphate transferase [Chloroflexi bacterium]|jgi:UDP-GlcNAc:undecaprenyl-phosphate GlcNAc-1-phosphate transferase|nr:MAG: undecaprenyl/decaprenyl-phosphate alpha-N-acetylglucosaminyl 1-phosphate transferase [Chloroflexota bacterium]